MQIKKNNNILFSIIKDYGDQHVQQIKINFCFIFFISNIKHLEKGVNSDDSLYIHMRKCK